MEPLLTIAIPTYNRASDLANLLQRIMPMAAQTGRRIGVMVANNASEDHTLQVVQQARQAFPQVPFKVFTNRRNLGFDGNIIEIYKRIQTPFVWYFSDDDLPEETAFVDALTLLNTWPQVDMVLFPYRVYSTLTGHRDSIMERETLVYRGVDDLNLYRDLMKWGGQVSSVLVRHRPGVDLADHFMRLYTYIAFEIYCLSIDSLIIVAPRPAYLYTILPAHQTKPSVHDDSPNHHTQNYNNHEVLTRFHKIFASSPDLNRRLARKALAERDQGLLNKFIHAHQDQTAFQRGVPDQLYLSTLWRMLRTYRGHWRYSLKILWLAARFYYYRRSLSPPAG